MPYCWCHQRIPGMWDSAAAGTAVQCGLLVYDVVWVFLSPSFAGGNVMLTVATSDIFSGPTRSNLPPSLLFSRLVSL